MRIAAVDIGTNTILLLVCDIDNAGTLTTLRHEQRIPRIGRDVDSQGVLAQPAFDHAAGVLSEYASIARSLGVETISACATSAVRDARNRNEFINHCTSRTGIPIRVLSGDEEALLTYRGATLSFPDSRQDAAVIDIGGGSTEIIFSAGGRSTLRRVSLQTGSVRITERFFHEIPPSSGALALARRDVGAILQQDRLDGPPPATLVGVAGTVTTLACLDMGLEDFSVSRVDGYTLTLDAIERWLGRLVTLAPAGIRALSGTTAGREDILTAGTLILGEMMRAYGYRELRVTTMGLRYGLALQVWEDLRSRGTTSSG